MRLIIFSLIILFGLSLSFIATAQEATITQSLEIKEPKLLPDSPFYFFKEWKRSIQMLLTTSTVEKTALAEKIASEKLVELQKLAEKGISSEIIQKATEKYQKQIERVKKLAEKVKEVAENNPEVNKFLDKFTQQQNLHEQVLQKLEQQVPPAVLEKIKEARENHLERFKEVMEKLETRQDQVKEKLEKVCIELYDPVCGKDGKTYSNKCFAKIAGVEVDYKGECQKGCTTDTDCPQLKCGLTAAKEKCPSAIGKCVNGRCVIEKSLQPGCKEYYWFDDNNKECGQKEFCGLFMYQSLRTFETREECLEAVGK